jgi:glycogen synthase
MTQIELNRLACISQRKRLFFNQWSWLMRSNAPLRILYAAGPGHVIGTYDHWKKGQDDPSQISITFSSQFFEVCKALNATAYIISSCGQREVRQDGAFRLEHRPNPLSQASGLLYHSGQLAYGLGLVVSALRFRANVVIADTGSTYWFVLSILSWMGVHVIPSLHCVLWRKYAPQRRLETILLSLSR